MLRRRFSAVSKQPISILRDARQGRAPWGWGPCARL